MKANELMIGDWVFDTRIKANVKVVAIDSEHCFKDIIGSVRVLSDDISLGNWAKYLEPISLTAEILELNGWQYGDWGDEFESDEYFTNETIDCDLHINDKEFEIRCVDAENITLNFVHELQHVLKLCGIEKEIKL